ncbi:MAG: hypothetical protein IKH90_00090 [Ruminococcus sp.]|nr:hypothetical protein [Ruminococcus sp.]
MIKRLLTAALACFMTVACAVTCFADNSTEDAQTIDHEIDVPQKIVFIGDSIPAGYGLDGYTKDASEPPKDSYAAILGKKYGAELTGKCPFQMKDLAVSGDTSSQLKEKINSGSFDKDIKDSDVVVISIGGNDLMRPMLEFIGTELNIRSLDDLKGVDPKSFAKPEMLVKMQSVLSTVSDNINAFSENIKSITDKVHQLTKGTIIFQTVYNPLDTNNNLAVVSNLVADKLASLNNAINTGSQNGSNYKICDISTAFAGKSNELTNINSFDIHPNAQGHQVISQELDKVIRQSKYHYKEIIKKEVTSSSDNSTGTGQKVSMSTAFMTLGLFFGGFILLFVIVMVWFKKKQN